MLWQGKILKCGGEICQSSPYLKPSLQQRKGEIAVWARMGRGGCILPIQMKVLQPLLTASDWRATPRVRVHLHVAETERFTALQRAWYAYSFLLRNPEDFCIVRTAFPDLNFSNTSARSARSAQSSTVRVHGTKWTLKDASWAVHYVYHASSALYMLQHSCATSTMRI